MLKNEVKDTVQTNSVAIKEWKEYFDSLHRDHTVEHNILVNDDQEIEIRKEQIERVIKQLKTRRSPESAKICNEMLKYARQKSQEELYKLFNDIQTDTIPNEWRQRNNTK